MLAKKIPDYPIYCFHCKYIRVTKKDGVAIKYEHDVMSSLDFMQKEELTGLELNEKGLDWWQHIIKLEKYKEFDFLYPEITSKFVKKAPWCLKWFCHQTIDIGLTDEEYIKSFEHYVNTFNINDADTCLMGAEDRWRWHGEHENREKPICRCEGCKKNGVITINH